MKQEIYSQLLTFSKYLLSKDANCIFDSQDIVHECWNFESEDIVSIKKEMTKFFWKNLRQPTIPFSAFKNIASGEVIPIEIVLKNGNKKYVHSRSCIKCGNRSNLRIDKRDGHINKLCTKCEYQRRKANGKHISTKRNPDAHKKYYLKHREQKIATNSRYNKTERGREVARLSRLRNKNKHLKANRLRGLLYYERNKERIIAKTREMRRLKIWKENPVKVRERYLRYKNKMLLKKANANEVNFNSH